ncbi:hypothetical protein [uncultured Tateyamaria sp.]|uniref:hypothetical protein n=1 Tax=uncultured Tateyamaria sp. TaxID=455651 RepID=UPI0026044108|nr:hypothetical protein [uncultured Tateyamaria sp.]
MTKFKLTASALFTAAALALTTPAAQAELSPSDINALNGKSGFRVLSSDGVVVGVSNGIKINTDRTRMFLRPRGGRVFLPSGGKDIVITVLTSQLTLRGGDLVLDADKQRLRTKAKKSFTDDSSPIEVILLNPR